MDHNRKLNYLPKTTYQPNVTDLYFWRKKKTFASPDLMSKDDLKSKRHSLNAIRIECQHNRYGLL